MNLKEYVKKYFARFPNKQHLILKGNTDSLLFKEKVVSEVIQSKSKATDFNKKPIYDINNDKNVYILISYNKDTYLNYEILYNYHNAALKSSKKELLTTWMDQNDLKIPELIQEKPKPKPQNINQERPKRPIESKRPVANLNEEKPKKPMDNLNEEKPKRPMANLNRPVVIDNKIKQVGVGILENNQLNLYSGTMENSICKLYLEKGNFMLTRDGNFSMFDRNIKIIEHGKFEVISHKLFEEETSMKLNTLKKKNNYNKINLDFTFYPDFDVPTYGTHYCLDKNAVEWKINKGPDYGSYAFSIPPFPECSEETPASFIFSLSEDDYNELKKNTKMINVFTTVTYLVNNKRMLKNIQFVMNLK